jgi:thioredoxin 1
MALEVNETNFDEIVLKSGKPVIVDFWAEWCGPCRMISPIIEEIEREYEGKVIVSKCNVDNSPSLAVKFGIRNIPTVLYFKNGNIVDRHIGVAPKKNFTSKLENLL